MKKIIFIFTLCFLFCSTQLHAARFGGGKSFGRQSSHSSSNSGRPQQNPQQNQQNQQSQQQPHNNQPPVAPAKPSFMSRIFPALAGLSIGALLGSLLGGHGLAGAMNTMLMMAAFAVFAGVAFYLLKKLFSKKSNKNLNHFQNSYQANNPGNYQGSNQDGYQNNYSNNYPQPTHAYAPTSNDSLSISQEVFLRTAKTTFIRMQTAYDNKDLADIRNFTTPEVFAEVQMQIQERGSNVNKTDIIQINASMLDAHESDSHSAKILFSGKIKEQENVSPVDINEVWHFVKQDNNWLISGIEQRMN